MLKNRDSYMLFHAFFKNLRGALAVFSAFLSLVIIGLVIGIYMYAYSALPLQESKTVFIQPGMGINQVGWRLKKDGVIHSVSVFRFFVRLTSSQGKIKAGEYEFTPGMSLRHVIYRLENHVVVYHFVTIPEGMTSCMVQQRLNGLDLLSGHIDHVPLEGSLLPGTYQYIWGMSKEQVLQDMQNALTHFQSEHQISYQQPDVPIHNWKEVMTLASMIEAETAVPEEREKIASVFINRLKKKMRLQSDPTVIYSVTKGCYSLDRPIRLSELRMKTPFNTYRIPALPATPINNPGSASILAALHPDVTPYLYFVATGDGGHVFAQTLAQHHRYVAEWRHKIALRKKQEKEEQKKEEKEIKLQPVNHVQGHSEKSVSNVIQKSKKEIFKKVKSGSGKNKK